MSIGLFVILFWLCTSFVAVADEVILKDGKRFSGLTESRQDTVILKSKYGDLNIPWNDIEKLKYDPLREIVVTTTDGNKLRGKLLYEKESSYTIVIEGGEIELLRSYVAQIKVVDKELAEERENLKRLVEKMETDARRLEKEGLLDEWKKLLKALHQLDPTNDYAGEKLGMIKDKEKWVEYPYAYEEVDFCGKKGWKVKAPPFVMKTDVSLKDAADIAKALLWILPRLKKVFLIDKETKIPDIEIHLYSTEELYKSATGEDKKGHYSYTDHRLHIIFEKDLCPELFSNMAFCFVDKVLGVGPKWEGEKLKDVGAPHWLVSGIASYLRGWCIPHKAGVTDSDSDVQNLGVPEDFLKELLLDLRDGTYCEPRPLTRIPVSKFGKKVYWYSWGLVFTLLHRKDFADGYNKMWDAIKSGKRHPSDYFDPFFNHEKLKSVMLQSLASLSKYKGQIAQNGTYGVTYLWHEEGLKLLEARQLKTAIAKYNSILALVPDDYVALYNLACAYSLLGDKHNGAMYLLKAYDAGFRDIEHIKNDPDLENIRDTEIYKSIIGAKKDF